MNNSNFHQAALAAILVPALGLSAAPASATTPKTNAKSAVLTCRTMKPEGLSYTVIKSGKGTKPTAESKVKVNYKGNLKATGAQFDAGQGVEFPISGVIPGFGQGLQLMQTGSKYRICIPASLGYAKRGAGEDIPPNSDLVFEVELLSFTSPPPKPIIPLAERTCAAVTATGLGYTMLKAGTGKAPTDADMTLVDFTTFDAESGVVMEKAEWEKVPMTMATPIFAEGLKMMQAGASYRFCMPKPTPSTDTSMPQEKAVNIIVDLLDVRVAPVKE